MTEGRSRTTARRLLADVCGAVVAVGVCGAILLAPVEPASPVVEASAQRFIESELWLAPASDPVVPSDLARGATLLQEGRAQDALGFFSRNLGDPVLGRYAQLYAGRAQMALERYEDAAASARQVIQTSPGGALGESALWVLATALNERDAWREAVPVWQTIAGIPSPRLPEALLNLARAAEEAKDSTVARGAYSRLYYEFPASPEAEDATRALARPGVTPLTGELSTLELGRADKLFAARRFADARTAYEAVRSTAPAADRPRVVLRVALCDYQLQKYAAARDALRAIIDGAGGKHPEAEFYWLSTLRGLRRDVDYREAVARYVAAYPTSALAETALNELATHYILADDDRQAAVVFTDMYARFPTGTYADRAAWKAGWWVYRTGNHRETVRLFESAATAMRRADYRPSWLYWAARSHEILGERESALAGYRQTVVFYRNSYYGREAARALSRLQGPPVTLATAARNTGLTLTPGAPPANAPLIKALLVAGLYADAVAELRKLQLEAGTSPMIEATIGYALNRQGELRPGITALRRAYPQFMAEGGEELPDCILRTIFPVAHWDLIARYARDRGIDLFLLTALVAQESTFQADVRSVANAWGLMPLPSTGRRYATKTGLRGFTPARLTDPETNVRLGTAYLSDLLTQFGDVAPALAAYNAGENRVAQWRAERPGLPRDEFVDDIPFPETQNYVKRIIGTAEDYRILYGHLAPGAVRQSAR